MANLPEDMKAQLQTYKQGYVDALREALSLCYDVASNHRPGLTEEIEGAEAQGAFDCYAAIKKLLDERKAQS